MKISKNKLNRLEIRISDEDKLLLEYLALKNGCSTSRYLRLCIDTMIFPYKKQIENKELSYDDIKTLCNNLLQQRKFFAK